MSSLNHCIEQKESFLFVSGSYLVEETVVGGLFASRPKSLQIERDAVGDDLDSHDEGEEDPWRDVFQQDV
jgi:hypothetical protein